MSFEFNDTNQMVLVSFKIIHIWSSCDEKMARINIFGHAFFGHNSGIVGQWSRRFLSCGLKFFIGVQETIIYRLAMRNPSYDTFFNFDFWSTLAGKWAWATRHHPRHLWAGASEPDQKVGPLSEPFAPTTDSSNYEFISRREVILLTSGYLGIVN